MIEIDYTGCELHSQFSTNEPFCPVCLQAELSRLREQNAELVKRIEQHNQECRALCMEWECPTYRPEKGRCADCTKEWQCHIDDLLEQPTAQGEE